MIHKYRMNGACIVLDVNSSSVHVVDELDYDILDYHRELGLDEIKERLKAYSAAEIDEAYNELAELEASGTLFSEDEGALALGLLSEREPVVKALCLHIAHACNLRCVYCFAGDGEYGSSSSERMMSFETGRAAIDFLIEKSGKRRNLEIDFFGGEPLLNFEVVKQIVEYARSVEKRHGKNFRFTLTTNGLLLDDDKLAFVNEHMHNVVLSIDGRPNINDANRMRPDGSGSYDSIVPIFKRTAESRKQNGYYVRGTFTAENLDFANDVLHLADLGFKQISVEPVVGGEDKPYILKREHLPLIFAEYERLAIEMIRRKGKGEDFNFFHYMLDLSGGPCLAKRVTGCGAGTEYLAVSPDGDIYPCHQFTGVDGFEMGNVKIGLVNNEASKKLSSSNVYTKPACEACFAKFYCSGGCAANAYFANGDFNKPYELGCELQRKRVECAVMIKAYDE